MSKKWFLWRGLATLILVGLLIAGGVAIHYAAWSNGYAAGQLVVEGAEGGTESVMPYGFGYHVGRPAAFMFGAGLLFKVVLGLLFFAVICKLIRFVIWGAAFRPMMAGPWPRHWHRAARWRRTHGPVPPWCWDWDESPEDGAKADSDEAAA